MAWSGELLGKPYVFKDREHAGQLLAQLVLKDEKFRGDLVLAIPNGGIPVGVVLAESLGLKFDLAICRKLQIPWNPEAGFGAVAPDGTLVLNFELLRSLKLSSEVVEKQRLKALESVREREKALRVGRRPLRLEGLRVVLVDDGLASGYTMLAAIRYAYNLKASKVYVAVPTASPEALWKVVEEVEKVYCPNVRSSLLGFAVADAYQNWHDLEDEEALRWLRRVWKA